MSQVTQWEELLVLAGFKFKLSPYQNRIMFDTRQFHRENRTFLTDLLQAVGIHCGTPRLLDHPAPSRTAWLAALDQLGGKTSEMLYPADRIHLREVDTHLLPLVLELNQRGFTTYGSCSGHGRRPATIYFEERAVTKLAFRYLRSMGLKVRCEGRAVHIDLPIEQLRELGWTLYQARQSLQASLKQFELSQREAVLEELLAIPGASGEEEAIRQVVCQRLEGQVDHLEVDTYGNILAQKSYGSGPTILLSAHLDVVPRDIDLTCPLVKSSDYWSRPGSILGADDRAGIALILNLLSQLSSSQFTGKIKLALTVEEEIGLCGARQIDPAFFDGLAGAISFDRRGSQDIVVGNGYEAYCDAAYGQVFEVASRQLFGRDLAYRMVQGGSSDLAIWSRLGVSSVNLSVGFEGEHTCQERLNLAAWHRTHDLAYKALQRLVRVPIEGRSLACQA